MKSLLNPILPAMLFMATLAHGQDVIRQRSCSNNVISSQVDSLKKSFEANGFMVMKEASISMESEYEMPVLVPMNQGVWYQVVFVGDPGSKLHEVRMFDYNEKQVVYKKLYGLTDGNVISYGYQPRFSEWHMIKPVQVNKGKKELCGYIMLLKKVRPTADEAVTRR